MSRLPRLNRPLVLETRAQLPDGAGGWTQSWQPLGTLWAEVRAGSGRERAEASARVSLVSYKIRVRAAPEGAESRPRPDQRFREGTRLYQIQAVADDDASRRYLTCHCVEEVLS